MGAGLGAGNQDGGAGGGTGCSRAVPSAGLSTRPVGQAVPTGRDEPSKASAPGFRNRSEGEESTSANLNGSAQNASRPETLSCLKRLFSPLSLEMGWRIFPHSCLTLDGRPRQKVNGVQEVQLALLADI